MASLQVAENFSYDFRDWNYPLQHKTTNDSRYSHLTLIYKLINASMITAGNYGDIWSH